MTYLASVNLLGHDLSAHIAEAPIRAHIDRTRVEQMLANLLDNAIKYTPRGGRITVELAPDAEDGANTARIAVRDTGSGLPADRLEDMFDMFVQYDRALARAQGGLGLGLTLVRHLAQLHGGSIHAQSEGPGRGTTMVLKLPRLAREVAGQSPSTPAADPPRASEPPQPRTRSVLMVEDNEDLRTLVAMRLRRAGHRVTEARDGVEGRRAALQQRPEVIILDLGLPELDGYQLARELREQPSLEGVRLIALSGYGSSDARRQSRESGFDVHIVKPVSMGRLLETVAHVGPLDASIYDTR